MAEDEEVPVTEPENEPDEDPSTLLTLLFSIAGNVVAHDSAPSATALKRSYKDAGNQVTIAEARAALHSLYQEARKSSASNLSIGYWSTAFNGAVVTQPRGKHFQALGRGIRPQRGVAPPRHPQLFLMPEEALVVFEWGGLQLEGLDSLHSGWKLAIPDVGIHRYCAYAYLKRLGFVLWRCEWPMLSLAEADCASPRSRWMDRQRPCRECRKRKHTAIRKNAQPNSDEIRRTREEGALIDVNLAGDSECLASMLALPGYVAVPKSNMDGVADRSSSHVGSAPLVDTEEEKSADFQVWRPGLNFSKASPPAVSFHLSVFRAEDCVPCGDVVSRLLSFRDAADNRRTSKVAVWDAGVLSWLTLTHL